MIGVSTDEIKNRLNENYSFKDIDNICENLQSYKLSINKLPFEVQKSLKMSITESKNDPLKVPSGLDDCVDDTLIRLAEGTINN
jgi:hypothetical protein